MKYVLTGSIGHISKPIAQQLIEAGHEVAIITSNEKNTEEIKKLGATALVGSIEDIDFLSSSFAGADAVYLMIPPKWSVTDWYAYQQEVANNYVAAIQKNQVQKVAVLSSIGTHMGKGAGPIDGLAYLELKLNEVSDIQAVYLRPSYFFYNFFSMIPLIQNAGFMGSNMPADHTLVLTHTADIADVASQYLLEDKFNGKEVVYISSDVKLISEITATLGESIGKSDLAWVQFTDEQSLGGMLQAGLPETIANGYTTMGSAISSKELEADYWKNEDKVAKGKVSLADFAKEFAGAFGNS
ncbi:MAG: NAD(P)H-binding protein [Arcicella sp.]|nr:NAD(P)H-binding protein [Arcicella sp.]